MMGSCLEERGHLAILIYFAIFGSCFLVSSSFYLINLQKISIPLDDPDTPCVPGLLAANSDPASVVNCADVHEWKMYAFTGIIYGILCLIVALVRLWPVLKRIYFASASSKDKRDGVIVIHSKNKTHKNVPSFSSAAGTKAVKKANAGVRRLVSKDEEKRTWTKMCSSCGHCMSTCSLFFGVITLWIISVVVPGFLAVNLYKNDAIRAKEDYLYVPAMALFATCLTSFTTVCVSCAFIILEESDHGVRHAMLDEESKEISDDLEVGGVTTNRSQSTGTTQPLKGNEETTKDETHSSLKG